VEEREFIPYSSYKSYLIEEMQEKKPLGVYENLLKTKANGEK
jgi:hypothetical protein|tara:strand:+ start:169 stop:294 length:126 start_codon:yes stop_codon:yes gene_type:complete